MKVKIKFKNPKDWDGMKKIAFAQKVVYLTMGGSDRIHGIMCEEKDKTEVKAFLKRARII